MITPMQFAYMAWAGNPPEECAYPGRATKCRGHYKRVDGQGMIELRDDELTCPRERAWRRYTRLRDAEAIELGTSVVVMQ